PGAAGGPERKRDCLDLRGRPAAGARGAGAGTLRPARHAPGGRRPGAGAAAFAGAELSAAASDGRPGEFLGEHLPAGAKGPTGAVPEACMAGGPVRGAAATV